MAKMFDEFLSQCRVKFYSPSQIPCRRPPLSEKIVFIMRRILLCLTAVSLAALPARAIAKSWFADVCDHVLGRASKSKPTPKMEEVRDLLKLEAKKADKFWAEHFAVNMEPVDEIEGSPLTVVAHLETKNPSDPDRTLSLKVIVNPKAAEESWDEDGTNLAHSGSIFILFEDATVPTENEASVRLSALMEREVRQINEENPELKVKLHVVPTSDFHNVSWDSDVEGKSIAWVEGNMRNFQVSRTLLLAAQSSLRAALKAHPRP
jgi:hypothetical protein